MTLTSVGFVPYLAFTILTFGCMLLYFRIARSFKIIDNPNQRSSHSTPAFRGGGIVFLFSIILWFTLSKLQYPYFVVGVVLIGIISFLDDIRERSPLLRISVQFTSFLFLGWQVGIFQLSGLIVVLIIIIGIGAINAFNFMDGINGISGIYAMVNFSTFLWLNENLVQFTDSSLVVVVMISVFVFLFFNYRQKAICFAGDVGSIALAFTQLFFCLQLIQTTGNYGWVLVFMVYGVETVVTIIYRLKERQNIFSAHRSHLYQYLANEFKWPHRIISLGYGILQLVFNVILIKFLKYDPIWIVAILLGVTGIFYVMIRERVLHKIGLKGFFGK